MDVGGSAIAITNIRKWHVGIMLPRAMKVTDPHHPSLLDEHHEKATSNQQACIFYYDGILSIPHVSIICFSWLHTCLCLVGRIPTKISSKTKLSNIYQCVGYPNYLPPKMWLFYPVAENNINGSQYGPNIQPSQRLLFNLFSSEDQWCRQFIRGTSKAFS